MNMIKICPKCGAIAEYDAYYGRTICTSCDWESEKESKENSNQGITIPELDEKKKNYFQQRKI